MIKLLTPTSAYTDEFNEWLAAIPPRILALVYLIKRFYRVDPKLRGDRVEVRYDPEKQRVIYQPVTIEPRVLVPRVICAEEQEEPAPAEAAGADEQKARAEE